jgi:sugar phosphate isomerase/epimerase
MERNYEFRKELLEVHRQNARDFGVTKGPGQLEINNDFSICIEAFTDRAILTAAKDLQDYLLLSMGLSLPLKRARNSDGRGEKMILLMVDGDAFPGSGGDKIPGSFRIRCNDQGIIVYGTDTRGMARGCYYIEDMMDFAWAPVLNYGDRFFSPAFSPRMTHSGYGLDQFPDPHLSAIAHAGMDAILVFTRGIDRAASGYLDFNELIYRARRFCLDVYAYSYIESLFHPDDPRAEAYYEDTYGKLFEYCPDLKGVVLVGESVEFPSRDPRVSGRRYFENDTDGIPNDKPTAGWWPCEDYPRWLNRLKETIRGKKPDADIVFWTYNWGYAPREERIRLINSLPQDISLMVTFEMFEERRLENIKSSAVDYTLSIPGPGEYFCSEAQAARERGIRLYTQACSAGLTWDIGVIPYEPCPYQWIKRYEAMLEAKEKHGLAGVMESHHFGYWPSFISLIEKYMFTLPMIKGDILCEMIAAKEFGKKNTGEVLEAWKLWSEGITHYVSTNEDQYGPFRIGPAYPLVFKNDVKIPSVPYAHFGGNKICFTNYGSDDLYKITARSMGGSNILQQRLPVEIRSIEKMLECFKRGGDILERVTGRLEGSRRCYGERMVNLGRFIERCAGTTINVKRWNICKALVRSETDSKKLYDLFNEMIKIGRDEISNTLKAIPLVQRDSRLGFEPSMEYIADEKHIRWKIRQVTQVIEKEIPKFIDLVEDSMS